jgi:hypothetical protein
MTSSNQSDYGYTYSRHTSATKKLKKENKKQAKRKLRRKLKKDLDYDKN